MARNRTKIQPGCSDVPTEAFHPMLSTPTLVRGGQDEVEGRIAWLGWWQWECGRRIVSCKWLWYVTAQIASCPRLTWPFVLQIQPLGRPRFCTIQIMPSRVQPWSRNDPSKTWNATACANANHQVIGRSEPPITCWSRSRHKYRRPQKNESLPSCSCTDSNPTLLVHVWCRLDLGQGP